LKASPRSSLHPEIVQVLIELMSSTLEGTLASILRGVPCALIFVYS
jgi:hypothetical protein